MPINQQHPRLYLASRSPRRRELLTQMGIQFDTIVFRNSPRDDPEVDETPFTNEDAVDYVERVARAKAEHGWRIVGWQRKRLQPVLAADTTLEFESDIIGKPNNVDDAKAILRQYTPCAHGRRGGV